MDRLYGKLTRWPDKFKTRKGECSNRSRCVVCDKEFRSHSRLDAICDLCWADNEMRPYAIKFGCLRRAGFAGGSYVKN